MIVCVCVWSLLVSMFVRVHLAGSDGVIAACQAGAVWGGHQQKRAISARDRPTKSACTALRVMAWISLPAERGKDGAEGVQRPHLRGVGPSRRLAVAFLFEPMPPVFAPLLIWIAASGDEVRMRVHRSGAKSTKRSTPKMPSSTAAHPAPCPHLQSHPACSAP